MPDLPTARTTRRCLAVFAWRLIILAGALTIFVGAAAPAVPAEPAAPTRVPITQFGAISDGRTLNTTAIQAAIEHAYGAGGGTVVIPEGVFLSGAIFLKPGVNLLLEKRAVLKGSSSEADYPRTMTRIEGHFEPWLPALVNADGVDRLRITGEGTLDGNGKPFWDAFRDGRKKNPNITNLEVARPRLLFIRNSRDVLVSGITLKDSGFWNLHIYRCHDVVLEKLNITAPQGGRRGRAPSSDGIDIDSSRRVTVRGCIFSVDDDCIAMKGTKGPFALQDKDSPPVEQILVSGCTFKAGHGALTLGSEATIIRNVVMENCVVLGNMPALRMKLRPDTPQDYEDILCRNLTLKGTGSLIAVAPWMQFFDLKGQEPPRSAVRNVTFSGIKGSFGSLGSIHGHDKAAIGNITFENVDVRLKDARLDRGKVANLVFRNVKVNGAPFAP
jgi:polygalacturonase